MNHLLFVGIIAFFMFLVIMWGYLKLPEARWQFMAVLPKSKKVLFIKLCQLYFLTSKLLKVCQEKY